ncbi:MAG: signal peptidase I [Actinobacteria bacterium]|uniref:signal peptidase I n=1 Tax=freshwater metagenome TaxID=449393 RepID=A0A6J7GMR5_9ZZZZ|nr:signal peptidase I [Actinomycetota bacterium]MTB27917.1 signal peptidase I [Actinomycetota bacterium]
MPKHSRWDLPLTLLGAVVVVLLFTSFVAKPFSIPSGSMENTLQVGDRVLVNRIVYHLRPIERGDVVVFDGTDSFVAQGSVPSRDPIRGLITNIGQSVGLIAPDGTDFVKRVVGVAGDHVQCCSSQGALLVNGIALPETYLFPDDVASDVTFDAVVPVGKLWVMGDHRSNSADSRAHLGDPGGGMVPTAKVIGRVMAVVWPPTRWGSVAIPQGYAKVAQ